MTIKASVEYISASANRFNRTAAASGSSLVAFGSGKLVAFWDAQVSFVFASWCHHLMALSGQPHADHGVFATLSGHGGLVTCVEFIDDDTILSADDTGSLRLWRNSNSSVRVCSRMCRPNVEY
jgi:elongator complex protein 2